MKIYEVIEDRNYTEQQILLQSTNVPATIPSTQRLDYDHPTLEGLTNSLLATSHVPAVRCQTK